MSDAADRVRAQQSGSREGVRSPADPDDGSFAAGPLPEGTEADAEAIGRPISFAQQRLWFLSQLEPESPSYNVQLGVSLKGPLDVPALEAGLTEIVRRHEILRTTFTMAGSAPRQLVSPAKPQRLRRMSLRELPAQAREAEFRRRAAQEAGRPFDLAQGPLFRPLLLRLDEQEHAFVLTMHHIIMDGWSKGVLFRELGALYGAFSRGQPSPLPELPIQYGDFAQWQRERRSEETLQKQLSYWKRKLGGKLPASALPIDRPRPPVASFEGARQTLLLPRETTVALKSLSYDEGATLFMTLLAAFKILLHRQTGQEDILVGTNTAGRTHVETEELIGFFVNLLVLRTDLSGNPRFRQLLRRVREVALEAYAHQELPFDRLVEELRPERDSTRNPLVQVLFVMQPPPLAHVSFPGLDVTDLNLETHIARFDLAVFVVESERGLATHWVYNAGLFEAATIEAMSARFARLLESILQSPETRVEQLEMLGRGETQRLQEAEKERLRARSARLRSMRRRPVDLSSGIEVPDGRDGSDADENENER